MSWVQMANSAHSEAVLALGRKLVDELQLEPSVDTLGRWMAHYIASLISECETGNAQQSQVIQKECFDAILALWRHRGELPSGKRPFEDLEPIVRAIESLDPEDDTPRYFRHARPPEAEDEDESETDVWLKLVDGLDYSAKLLIGYCLEQAAYTAVDSSKEWVKLAEAAGIDNGPSETVIRFVSSDSELDQESNPEAELRRRGKVRLDRLEGFIKCANQLAEDLRAQLDALPEDNVTKDKGFA